MNIALDHAFLMLLILEIIFHSSIEYFLSFYAIWLFKKDYVNIEIEVVFRWTMLYFQNIVLYILFIFPFIHHNYPTNVIFSYVMIDVEKEFFIYNKYKITIFLFLLFLFSLKSEWRVNFIIYSTYMCLFRVLISTFLFYQNYLILNSCNILQL